MVVTSTTWRKCKNKMLNSCLCLYKPERSCKYLAQCPPIDRQMCEESSYSQSDIFLDRRLHRTSIPRMRLHYRIGYNLSHQMLLRRKVFLWYPQNLCWNICIHICRSQSVGFQRKPSQLGWPLHCIVGCNWSLPLYNLSGLTQWSDHWCLKGGELKYLLFHEEMLLTSHSTFFISRHQSSIKLKFSPPVCLLYIASVLVRLVCPEKATVSCSSQLSTFLLRQSLLFSNIVVAPQRVFYVSFLDAAWGGKKCLVV